MGDSITFGQHVDPSLRWSSLVHAYYEARFQDTDIHVQVLNRGISGETTRMGLERFAADVQNAFPDLMTLQFGLNDCNCWLSDRGLPRVSPAAFHANLVEMIERARHFGCHHIILSTNHVTLRRKPMLSGERYEAANARYSGILRSVAKETGVILCDIRQTFEPFLDDELSRMLLPYPDHLHLSAEGNKVYYRTIFPYIEAAVERVLHAAGQANQQVSQRPTLSPVATAVDRTLCT
jgi:lysophospholipase L1-like esterase